MAEDNQGGTEGGIDYASITGPDGREQLVPGIVPVSPEGIQMPERVDFGIDGLRQWRIEVRAKDGTLLHTSEDGWHEEDFTLAEFPTDSPAGAVALQEALKARYRFAEVVWRPGVMNSVDEQRALAHQGLAVAAADRESAREATEAAEKSLREALPLGQAAGIGPGEMARRTGYARSTIAKALNSLDTLSDAAAVPAAARE